MSGAPLAVADRAAEVAPSSTRVEAARAEAAGASWEDRAARFEPVVRFGEGAFLRIEPLFEGRYSLSERSRVGTVAPVVTSFTVPRARVAMRVGVDDRVQFHLRFGAKSNGDARFEQAYGILRFGPFELRGGQYPLYLNGAERPAPQRLATADFASYANVFAGGQTQGVSLRYVGPVRATVSVDNGMRTGFTELASPIAADVSVTGSAEARVGDAPWAAFDGHSSFRGSRCGGRLALTGHFQSHGATASRGRVDVTIVSAEANVAGDGWSVVGGATLSHVTVGPTPMTDFGAFVVGSVFLSPRVETYAQYDTVASGGAVHVAPLPTPGTSDFRTVTVGTSYYLFRGSSRAKVQTEVTAALDPQAQSLVIPSDNANVLPSSRGPQWAGRVQLVLSL